MEYKINDNYEDISSSFTNIFSIQKEEKVKLGEIFSIQKEEKVKLGENLTSKKSILLGQQSEKAVCEIIKDNGYGSGFFIRIKINGNEICCLWFYKWFHWR